MQHSIGCRIDGVRYAAASVITESRLPPPPRVSHRPTAARLQCFETTACAPCWMKASSSSCAAATQRAALLPGPGPSCGDVHGSADGARLPALTDRRVRPLLMRPVARPIGQPPSAGVSEWGVYAAFGSPRSYRHARRKAVGWPRRRAEPSPISARLSHVPQSVPTRGKPPAAVSRGAPHRVVRLISVFLCGRRGFCGQVHVDEGVDRTDQQGAR